MLSEIKASFKQITSEKELLRCTKLKKIFLVIRDKERLSSKEKLDTLMEALLVATAYEERLTTLKITCKSLRNKTKVLYTKKKNEVIIKDETFFKKKKYDQANILSLKTEKINLLYEDIDNMLDMIEDAITYVRNASFNLKSIMSTLKEYLGD